MRTRRRGEEGFALLFILLIAAGIAIALYAELPRVAFETQRNREELLQQRGKEYQRAIGLYYRKLNRLPQKMEDLESTNNLRFLRRRYVDPMTGNEEWRLVHMVNGVMTDSLVKPVNADKDKDKDKNSSTGLTPASGMNVDPSLGGGSNDPNQQDEVNPAVQRRASDKPLIGPMIGPGAQSNDPNAPNVQFVPGQPPVVLPPGQVAGQIGPGGQLPQPGTPGATGQPGTQSQGAVDGGRIPMTSPYAQVVPGQPPVQFQPPPAPGQPATQGTQQTGFQQTGVQAAGGLQPSAGSSQTGSTSSFGNNQGAQTVQNMLGGARNVPAMAGTGATGIIGVATKYKGPAIKVYNEQKRYEKWEFVWDPQKDPAITKNLPQMPATTNPGNTPTTSSDSSSKKQ